MKKTKIIGTIGPVSENEDTLKKMIESGLNCIRINMSHAYYEECINRINIVRKINKKLNTNVGILIDTKGPEIRSGKFKNGKAKLEKDKYVYVTSKEVLGDNELFSINYPNLEKDLDINSIILLNNGLIRLKVVEKLKDKLKCIIENSGIIKDKRSINFPGVKLTTPFLSKKDIEDINFAIDNDVDFIALSFVSTKNDVLEVKDILREKGNNHINLISKIENGVAVENIDEILKASDGIMVARGDLGVEVPMEKLPFIQKKLVEKAHIYGKICIVATEMLASMETSLRPTRAEVSDVANAVLDGTDAIMLSGETASGDYPVETVEMMSSIAIETEKGLNNIDMAVEKQGILFPTEVIASCVVDAAKKLDSKYIIASTNTGYTARAVSRQRPLCTIIATTPNEETVRSLVLNYGIIPVLVPDFVSTDDIVCNAREVALSFNDLKDSDTIIITGGFPNKKSKHTNFMKIEKI